MNANASTSLLALLIVACLASGASALEVGQTQAPAGDTPSFGLPAFLDGARLPDLQEAWRAHFGQPQEAPEAPAVVVPEAPAVVVPEAPAVVVPISAPTPEMTSPEGSAASPDPASDAAIESARAAITRAEQASREAESVRTRAEELSRRFGAGDAAASPAAAEPTSGEGDAITTGAIPPADGEGTAATGEAPVDQPAPTVETTAKAEEPTSDEAASDEKSKPSSGRLMRAGLSSATARPAVAAAPRKPVTAPARSAGPEPAAGPTTPSGAGPMPLEMRAFGWNSQP